ncbi:hypothetical protein HDA40_005519 [Hamadaea flava]|uniref:Uncharacterized protein n=1 Tax=Hamadaea flava TaxID=1742688 RepID=A0ABV8LZK5_9ACTN|nr:hypothetical protein [Hamadaea flava]MCP2327012.1 hypothetical protein [Hamadaea flava]
MTTKGIVQRALRAAAVSGAAATLAVVTMQGPASAYAFASIPGGLGTAEAAVGNRYFTACDGKPNGIGVYGRFHTNNNADVDVADLDGHGGNCGELDYSDSPYYAVRIQAIQRDGTASAWSNTTVCLAAC